MPCYTYFMKKCFIPYFSLILVSFFITSCCRVEKEKVSPQIPPQAEYKSSYEPQLQSPMPVIRIQSDSGKNDFVSAPLSDAVKKHMLTWGQVNESPSPWYEKCKVSVSGGESDLVDLPAKVKVRGNWTTSYEKKPLRINFTKKQSLLGLNGGREFKNWVLLAMHKDWSMLRDASALYIGKLISPDYSSDFAFVEVYVNSEYWGVYLLCEQQEVRKGRIEITSPKKDYKNTDTGYLIEFDGYYFTEKNSFEIDYLGEIRDFYGTPISTALNSGYTIKSKVTDPKQKDFIESYMNNLWKVCYSAVYEKKFYEFNDDFTGLREAMKISSSYDCVSRYIDLESLVNAYILNEIVCDPDLYWSSFFMDIDFSPQGAKKLKFEAFWDFDSALGNKNFCADSEGLFAAQVSWDVNHMKKGTGNPWMFIFAGTDWFQAMVEKKWESLHAQNISSKLENFIQNVQSLYARDFARNTARWDNIGEDKPGAFELCEASKACKNQAESARYLQGWLSKRFLELDRLWLAKR